MRGTRKSQGLSLESGKEESGEIARLARREAEKGAELEIECNLTVPGRRAWYGRYALGYVADWEVTTVRHAQNCLRLL